MFPSSKGIQHRSWIKLVAGSFQKLPPDGTARLSPKHLHFHAGKYALSLLLLHDKFNDMLDDLLYKSSTAQEAVHF